MATTKVTEEAPTVRQIDVTNLTVSQRRKLFSDYLNQAGFTGFTKTRNGKQTYYTFTYQKEN